MPSETRLAAALGFDSLRDMQASKRTFGGDDSLAARRRLPGG
jgi:hypothetical protein